MLLAESTSTYGWPTPISWTKSTLSMSVTAIIPTKSAVFVLDDKQRLFGWGDKTYLGINSDDFSYSNQYASSPIKISSFVKINSSPHPSQPISPSGDDSSFSVSFADISSNPFYGKLAAAIYSTVALKPDGSVYTWGDGERGQLGHPREGGIPSFRSSS
ncbi:hypothetical protein GEMRC1_001501 [Eukaryota sp. GEM-RC1]